LLLVELGGPPGLAGWMLLVVAAAAAAWWLERRRAAAEAAAEEARRRLHQAQKLEAVGRLAGGVAHDVNNYLAVIRSHCEAVLVRDPPRTEVEETMRTVVATVLRASSLVERLLAFGRRQPARPEAVDLNHVVEAYAGMLRGTREGVAVAARLAPELWPVEADLSQTEQVLANLVVNALDATPAGGRVEIVTANRPGSGAAGGDEVALEVRDTGCGIPPELHETVFEPFFTTKEGKGSSGLGLSTVYGIVRQAGGRIELDSASGRGTTVRVLLPRASRPAPPPAGEQRDLLEGTEAVLLVDDNRELAAAVDAYLGDLGYRVTTAAGAAEALAAAAAAAAAEEPFDAVITDVQLGGGGRLEAWERAAGAAGAAATVPLTGPELVARLRQDGAPVRAVYMTGYTERIALRSMQRGDEAWFVKKPFSLEGLARALRGVLDAGLEIERP
jgi:signal transduction histidine kinase/DNA-binding NarL/FixJ family response regulator